jgi:nicotine blue oxidoreductase
LVGWAVDAAIAAGFDETVVVQGAIELADELPASVTLLTNRRWSDGQAGSLGIAVEHARSRGHEVIVVGLGDQPLVGAGAWRAVAAAAPEPPIAVASYGGRRGNPVRLPSTVWSLLSFTGDEGARQLMRRRPDLVGEVACSGSAADVDTVEDLDQWS